MKDDVRYMSHEIRIAEGYMKAPEADDRITSKAARKTAQRMSDGYYVQAGEIRQKARAARAAGDVATYDKLVASFRFYTDKRHAIDARIAEYDRIVREREAAKGQA